MWSDRCTVDGCAPAAATKRLENTQAFEMRAVKEFREKNDE